MIINTDDLVTQSTYRFSGKPIFKEMYEKAHKLPNIRNISRYTLDEVLGFRCHEKKTKTYYHL